MNSENFWDQEGVPHKGWNCVSIIDLKEDYGAEDHEYETCQMCGKEKIRFVHVMTHESADSKRVGCVCAGKMTDDYEGAKNREKKLRNKSARKKNWLKRIWYRSQKGNLFINTDGYNIGIFRDHSGRWGTRIGGKYGSTFFSSEQDAKLALFEEFWRFLNA